MKKNISNDEIDLSYIFLSLWEDKFKVLIITSAFIIFGFLYFNFLDKNFTASTNIKPISTFENQKYKVYNSLAGEVTINIDSDTLLSLFISKIQTEEIVKKGIIQFELIKKDKFINEEDYNEAIRRNAILIIDQMSSPFIGEKNKKDNIHYWQFHFQTDDKINWRNFLKYIEKQVNEEIRQYIINQFNTDLDILINNSKFKLEDVNQNILNELDDYQTSTSNRLAFLKEQAEIARTLGISKNTLETESFLTDNTIVTNIKSESSYYLKGFEMIEKEISLIDSRKNKKAFVKNLVELEKTKRAILQDKKIERLKVLFSKTPVYNKSEFIAGKVDYDATIYIPTNLSLLKILSFSLAIGLLISIIYLSFNNVIALRK